MNILYFACLAGIISFAAFVTSQDPCPGKPDNRWNPHLFGCNYFTYCDNGTEITEYCVHGEVFERDSKTCKDIYDPADSSTCNSACGTTPDCTGKTGIFGDTIPNCQTFHWCINGVYLANSRQYCPATLVWDSVFNYCNFPYNVPAPCGSGPSP